MLTSVALVRLDARIQKTEHGLTRPLACVPLAQPTMCVDPWIALERNS